MKLVCLSMVLVLAACSSNVAEPTTGTDDKDATEPAPRGEGSGSASTSSPASPASPAPTPAPPSTPKATCSGGGTPEVEQNDSEPTATKLTTSGGCGELSSEDDVDVFAFDFAGGDVTISVDAEDDATAMLVAPDGSTGETGAGSGKARGGSATVSGEAGVWFVTIASGNGAKQRYSFTLEK